MGDVHAAYAGVLAAAAPYASQLALGGVTWPILFPLFALPALSTLISLGNLSGKGPLTTFQRLSPIGAGIGWALTWHTAERLYVECLRGAQNLLYIFFSIRTRLDWALDCDHSYNTRKCNPFDDVNATHEEFHRFPDNFWPAQEFNRYLIRGNPIDNDNLSTTWEANEWYLGRSSEHFYAAVPDIPLSMAHILIWSAVYLVVVKCPKYLDVVLTRVCTLLPALLYLLVILGLSISGFSFGASTEDHVPTEEIEKVPADFWADLKGFYRASLTLVDYSTAFTGMSLVMIRRLRPGSAPLLAHVLVPLMMVPPILLSIIVRGCEGHIASLQPAYKTYVSTDEVIAYDLVPTCLATAHGSSLLAFLFYVAHFLYTTLGPLIVYTLFIYTTFMEQFPLLETQNTRFFSAFFLFTAALSSILYMPMGTKVITFFRYVSQSTTVHLLIFVLIFFVYGWQNLETDVLTATTETSGGPLWRYLVGPSSPLLIGLMFTIVPCLLCTKTIAVYDLLLGGNDLVKHIDAGTQFIEAPELIRRLAGYVIMFAPVAIVILFALHAIYVTMYQNRMPLRAAFQPTSDWLSHQSMTTHRPKAHSIAYVLFNSMRGLPSYRTTLLLVMIIELFVFLLLASLLFINSFLGLIGEPNAIASNFRTIVLIVLLTAHAMAILEMRWIYNKWDQASRLSLYIAVATLETAFLNGYMWMFAFNNDWGSDLMVVGGPLFLLFMNTVIRGLIICAVIAVRAHIREAARPTMTREATEFEPDAHHPPEVDVEDDTPIIFEMSR